MSGFWRRFWGIPERLEAEEQEAEATTPGALAFDVGGRMVSGCRVPGMAYHYRNWQLVQVVMDGQVIWEMEAS